MIQIITGLPRSGKTYRAVKYIYDFFVNHKAKDYSKYEYLYTNIGGFKFKEINEILLSHSVNKDDSESFIKETIPLKFEKIYEHLEKLYEMAEDEKEDEELIKYLQYHNLTPSLFIIDECYRYFSKRSDPVLVWWLAYHGHLGMDIILILQNKSLMHSDYKAFTEVFIDAQPKSKSLRDNQLRYHHYASDSYSKEQRYNTDSLIGKKEIFDLYKSGDIHKPQKIVYKFISIAIGALFVVFMLANYFVTDLKDRANANEDDTTSQPNPNLVQNQSFPINMNGELINIRCDEKHCWNIDKKFERNEITLTYFKFVVVKFELELQFQEVKNEVYKLIPLKRGYQKVTLAYLTDYYYLIPPDLKKSYLSTLFVPRKYERQELQINNSLNPFNNNDGESENEDGETSA